MPIKHTLTTTDGVNLSYFLWRQTQRRRPLLMMVHGMGSNHSRWTELIESSHLAAHWDIIAPDLRGQGESLTRGRITLEMWAQDLITILDNEHYPQAVFIGHSMGAHVLLHVLKYRPRCMRGMVLIDPLSQAGFTAVMKWIWRLRAIIYALIAVLRLGNYLGIGRKHIPLRNLRDSDRYARQLIVQGKQKEMVKHYSSFRVDLKYNPIANYLQYTLQTLRPLPNFERINIETLILLSAGSSYDKGNTTHSLVDQIPHATIAEISCNHWPLTEKPQEVRAIIETWLEQLEAQTSQ